MSKTATENLNGKTAVTPVTEVVDIPTPVEVVTPPTAKKEQVQNEDELPELDYVAVKSLEQAVLIIAGTRLENPEELIGGTISAVGIVYLQLGTKRIKMGKMTAETLELDRDAIVKIFSAGFATEDLLSMQQDALKAWCLNFKLALAKGKATSSKAKKEARLARSKALLAKLEG